MFIRLKQTFLLWGQRKIENGAWFLAPISLIWGFVSFWKNFLYDRGWLAAEKVSCPVVSIGNLVAGGTGKTPLVHLLGSFFEHVPIAILSRGYGEIPDEPLLLQRRLKGAKVYVGKDRRALAKKAVEEGAKLILLDDGFQYRKLHRDFDLVLLSASDPFGRGHYLPWGFLRDHPRRLQQADLVLITGNSTHSFQNAHVNLEVKVERILGLGNRMIESIQHKKVAIFCGIAKPKLFKKTVEDLGAHIVYELVLADHGRIELSQLKEFAKAAQARGAEALVCTEKDFVKLEPVDLPLPVLFLEISLCIREGKSQWENLIAKINQKIDNSL